MFKLPKTFIPGSALAGCDQVIRRLGGDPLVIAAQSGVPETVFADPSLPVDADACLRFFELAAQECDCDTLGIQLGAQLDMTFLGPIWVLIQDAQTPYELLQDLQRHLVLFTAAINVGLIPTAAGLECSVEIAGQQAENDRQAVEYCLSQVIRYLRERLDPRWHPRSVQLRHRAPANPRMHHQHFGPNVFFNCETTAFVIDHQTLTRPLNNALNNARRGHAMVAALIRQEYALDWDLFAHKVEAMVRAIMPSSFPTQQRIAQELRLSQRTLQRNLAHSGNTFEGIRDKVRAQLAAKYLKQSSLSIVQIAELLGYSQSSAFCRAFARWHGVSPLNFKKRCQVSKMPGFG